MPPEDLVIGPIDRLKADASISRKGFKKRTGDICSQDLSSMSAKNQLVLVWKLFKVVISQVSDDIHPLIDLMCDQLAEQEELYDELVEHQESYIQKDLAIQIFSTIALAGQLVELVREVASQLDDLKRKKIMDAVETLERSAEVTSMAVSNAIEIQEEESDEEESEEDSEDEELEETPITAGEDPKVIEDSVNDLDGLTEDEALSAS